MAAPFAILAIVGSFLCMLMLMFTCCRRRRRGSPRMSSMPRPASSIAIDMNAHEAPAPPPLSHSKSKSSYARILENRDSGLENGDCGLSPDLDSPHTPLNRGPEAGEVDPLPALTALKLPAHGEGAGLGELATPRVPSPRQQQQQVRLMAEIRKNVGPVELQEGGCPSGELMPQRSFLAGDDVRAVRAAVDEIRTTEGAYVHVLRVLVEQYMPRIREHLEPAEVKALFGNLPILKGVNETLLEHLTASHECATLDAEVSAVANAFHTLVPYLKLYSLYCAGYFAGLELLTKIRTERPAADEAIAKAESELTANRQGEGDLALSSCLFRPVKRLCLYPLLLTSLLKEIENCEPRADEHASFCELTAAATAVQAMAGEVNEMVRLAENRCRLIEVHERLRGAYPDLIAPHRRFVLEKRAWLLKQDAKPAKSSSTSRESSSKDGRRTSTATGQLPKECTLWLLSDRLLIARRDRFSEQYFHLKEDFPLNTISLEPYAAENDGPTSPSDGSRDRSDDSRTDRQSASMEGHREFVLTSGGAHLGHSYVVSSLSEAEASTLFYAIAQACEANNQAAMRAAARFPTQPSDLHDEPTMATSFDAAWCSSKAKSDSMKRKSESLPISATRKPLEVAPPKNYIREAALIKRWTSKLRSAVATPAPLPAEAPRPPSDRSCGRGGESSARPSAAEPLRSPAAAEAEGAAAQRERCVAAESGGSVHEEWSSLSSMRLCSECVAEDGALTVQVSSERSHSDAEQAADLRRISLSMEGSPSRSIAGTPPARTSLSMECSPTRSTDGSPSRRISFSMDGSPGRRPSPVRRCSASSSRHSGLDLTTKMEMARALTRSSTHLLKLQEDTLATIETLRRDRNTSLSDVGRNEPDV